MAQWLNTCLMILQLWVQIPLGGGLFGLLNLGSIPGKENSFLLVAFLFLRILGWETTKMKSSSRVILT